MQWYPVSPPPLPSHASNPVALLVRTFLPLCFSSTVGFLCLRARGWRTCIHTALSIQNLLHRHALLPLSPHLKLGSCIDFFVLSATTADSYRHKGTTGLLWRPLFTCPALPDSSPSTCASSSGWHCLDGGTFLILSWSCFQKRPLLHHSA